MPYIRLSTQSDDFNLYWRSNLTSDSDADPSHPPEHCPNFVNNRPTILLLAPAFLSVDFLDEQFDDPALSSAYNLVAFDPPGYGRSVCPKFKTREQASRIDDWVMAALVGDFCMTVGIPEVHLFAPMAWAAYVAPRVSLLFPGLCRSITMCGISYGAKWTPEYRKGMFEIVDAWPVAAESDIETCLQNFQYVFFGETKMNPELVERIQSTWKNNWSGANMLNFMVFGPLSLMRVEITAEQAAQITTPILILHGDTMKFTTPAMAYEMAASFTALHPLPISPATSTFPSATFTVAYQHTIGAQVEIIPGAPYGLAILPEYTSRVNRELSAHVDHATLADHRYALHNPPAECASSRYSDSITRRREGMNGAYTMLKALFGPVATKEMGLDTRDPESVMSFSMRSKQVEEEGYRRWFLPCLAAEQRAAQ